MNQGIVCDTPESIRMFTLLSLKGRLKMEIKTGMRFRVATAPAVRRMFGLPRGCRKQKCLEVLEAEIARQHAVREQEQAMHENHRYQEACESGKLDV